MNITADPTTPGGLGTFGFDDEGVPARAHRSSARACSSAGSARARSGFPGSMRADGWSRMPLVRMTNLHLEPGEGTLDELIAGVERGLYLETNRSWSIDDKRLNFQFGTQIAWEIATESSGGCSATRRTPASRRSSGARSTRVAGPRGVAAPRPDELRQGTAGAVGARLARRIPARFRGVQVGVRVVSALDLAGRALEQLRPRPTRPRRSSSRSVRGSRASPVRSSTSRR